MDVRSIPPPIVTPIAHVRRDLTLVALVCAALGVFVSRTAAADNFAPIARITATPIQVFVGEPVQLSSADSIDPDNAPQPLTFQWDFGDGTTSSQALPSHVYSTPRAYPVTLTVSDGADTGVDLLIVHVLARPLGQRSRQSSPIVLSPSGDRLWVVNPDSNSISIVSIAPAGLELVAERPVCRTPRTLALSNDASTLYVACQGERAVATIDLASDRTSLIAVGAEPYGVVVLPTGALLVSDQGDDQITWIGADLVTTETWPAGRHPRAIAVTADGTRAFVTSYTSDAVTALVSVYDLVAHTRLASIPLANDPGPDTASSGRGIPNLLSAAAVDPAGRYLWVGGLKANTTVGQYRTGGAIAPHNWLRGIAAPIDLSSATEVLRRRIDTNDADSVSAIAMSSDGRYAYLAHQGAGRISIYDLSKATLFDPGAGTSVPFEGRLDTGDAPQGIAVTPDGKTIYVVDYLSREVVAIDVQAPVMPRVTARLVVAGEPLSSELLNGKRLFFRSREPVHSKSNYVACASCHADGQSQDGQVWDFTQGGEGLRNTIDLRGHAGMQQGHVHWSGNFDEIQDFEVPIIQLFGGTGLADDGAPPNPPLGPPNAGRSQDLDDLAAYVTSLAFTPRSPFRTAAGALSEAAQRGEVLFSDPALRCTECHAPPSYTISSLGAPRLFDVGTLAPGSGMRLGVPLPGIDVPTLIGVWDGAPYYHDGSAPTLRDVFRARASTLESQLTASLDDGQLADLIAFLRSLDAPAPDPMPEPVPVPPAGCGCRSADPTSTSVTLLLAMLFVLKRRRPVKETDHEIP